MGKIVNKCIEHPRKLSAPELISYEGKALAQSTKHDLAESQLSFSNVNNSINTSSSVGQNCQDFDVKSSFSSLAMSVYCLHFPL